MLTVLGPTLVAVVADAFFPGGPGIRYALSIVVPAADTERIRGGQFAQLGGRMERLLSHGERRSHRVIERACEVGIDLFRSVKR
jgi:hypothetical protein